MPLEPSSEAEALSHVASSIATSLSVGDDMQTDEQIEQQQQQHSEEYIVSDINIPADATFNGQAVDGQNMIMLIDNETFQNASVKQCQDAQGLEIPLTGQVQTTSNGSMILYIDSDAQSQRAFFTYGAVELPQGEKGEVVEEVLEEVEEGDEELIHQSLEDGNQVEEVIQYVEYDDNQQEAANVESEAVMIIEEEHVEEQSEKIVGSE